MHAAAHPEIFKQFTDSTSLQLEFEKTLTDKDYHVFIAEVDRVPAGYLIAEWFRSKANAKMLSHEMIYVHQLSVQFEYRRLGVATALLDVIREICKTNSVDQMALDIWSFNKSAKAFFKNYGLENYNEKMWMRVDG